MLTDAAPAMIAECRRNLASARPERVSYEVMDAGEAGGHAQLDLIVSSMTLHWLADPAASLERLRPLLAPDGALLFAQGPSNGIRSTALPPEPNNKPATGNGNASCRKPVTRVGVIGAATTSFTWRNGCGPSGVSIPISGWIRFVMNGSLNWITNGK